MLTNILFRDAMCCNIGLESSVSAMCPAEKLFRCLIVKEKTKITTYRNHAPSPLLLRVPHTHIHTHTHAHTHIHTHLNIMYFLFTFSYTCEYMRSVAHLFPTRSWNPWGRWTHRTAQRRHHCCCCFVPRSAVPYSPVVKYLAVVEEPRLRFPFLWRRSKTMKEKENVSTVRFGLIRACVLLQVKWTSGCCCCCCCYGVGIGMNLYINQHGRHSLHLNLLGLIRNREIVLFCLVDKKKKKKKRRAMVRSNSVFFCHLTKEKELLFTFDCVWNIKFTGETRAPGARGSLRWNVHL